MLLEPGHRLEVVVEDLGRGREDDVDRFGAAVEVGRQDLDRRPGPRADGQDALAEVLGAAVGRVVAGHRRDHDVPQAQPGAGLGQPVGLVDRNGLGLAPLHRAEAARAGADLAQDHERRRPAGPAFRAVRATAALADRLEPQLGDQVLGEVSSPRRRDRPLEPLGKRRRSARGQSAVSRRRQRHAGRRGEPEPACSPGALSVDMSGDLPADQGWWV